MLCIVVAILILRIADGHYLENNIIGPTCAENSVEYSSIVDYDQHVAECDKERKHINAEGYFVPVLSKSVLQALLPPMKNRFRATELTGAFESCSLTFNFGEPLNAKHGCSSYAPLLDCFRQSALMICEGIPALNITLDMSSAADPWPPALLKPGDNNPIHSKNNPQPKLNLNSFAQPFNSQQDLQQKTSNPSSIPKEQMNFGRLLGPTSSLQGTINDPFQRLNNYPYTQNNINPNNLPVRNMQFPPTLSQSWYPSKVPSSNNPVTQNYGSFSQIQNGYPVEIQRPRISSNNLQQRLFRNPQPPPSLNLRFSSNQPSSVNSAYPYSAYRTSFG